MWEVLVNEYRVGVDVGGTNIDVGLVNQHYNIIANSRISTSQVANAADMAERIKISTLGLLEKNYIDSQQVKMVGIGVPGSVDLESGTIEYANNLNFANVPFLDILKHTFPDEYSEKISLENDANAATIGEYIVGKYHVSNFVMVTIGTGIGCGFIINGKLVRGINGAAGELGHMVIDIHGADCNCGRNGCFENFASASALVRQMRQEIINNYSIDDARRMGINDIDAKQIIDNEKKGDQLSRKVFMQYLNYLSEGLANLINILQPDVIVLSGGITRSGAFFIEQLRKLIYGKIYSRQSKQNTLIKCADAIKDSGHIGIIGASCIGMISS